MGEKPIFHTQASFGQDLYKFFCVNKLALFDKVVKRVLQKYSLLLVLFNLSANLLQFTCFS